MRRLTGPKRVLALASAAFLITALTGTALAMMDPGLTGARPQSIKRQVEQPNTTFNSPVETPQSSHEIEMRGTVEAISTTGWTISGHSVTLTTRTQVDNGIDIGSEVKVEGTVQPDGSIVAHEIKLIVVNGNDNGNSNGNENENHNGNVNANGNHNENENENHNGNVNANGNHNENENENHNGNVNANGNSNENDDDHGGNGNHNEDDHHDEGGNGNHSGDDGDHGGGDD